jgi:predicted DNA-binding transcriptional regulator AlpA
MPESSPARWPALFTTAILAEYTGLSTRTIEKLDSTGALPASVKLPGDLRCKRWRREDVDQFLADLPAEKK